MEGSMQLEQLVTTTNIDGFGCRVNNERGQLLLSMTAATKTQINPNQTLVCCLAFTGGDPREPEREGESSRSSGAAGLLFPACWFFVITCHPPGWRDS
jgi:hypothetical protein